MIELLGRLPTDRDFTVQTSVDQTVDQLRDKLNELIRAISLILKEHSKIQAAFEDSQ